MMGYEGERWKMEKESRRMFCVCSRLWPQIWISRKSADCRRSCSVLESHNTTTMNVSCFTQRAENTQPANQRTELGTDSWLNQSGSRHRLHKLLLWWGERGGGNASHKPITRLTAKLANQEADGALLSLSLSFLTPSVLLRGERWWGKIKRDDFSSSLLQTHGSRGSTHTQTADRRLIFTAVSAADTELWRAVWLWNTQSQLVIHQLRGHEDTFTSAGTSAWRSLGSNGFSCDSCFWTLWRR